jgi:hypothetical protein
VKGFSVPLGLIRNNDMETSEPQFTAEDNLIASNLLLRAKLELEFCIIVSDELPFTLQEQNHLLQYLLAVETVMKNVPRGTVQDFACGQYYYKTNEKW